MKRILLQAVAGAALIATSALAQTPAAALPSAQQLVEKYVQAIGGREALARMNSRHVVGEVSIPAMGMSMTTEAWSARPNRYLSKTEMPGMSFSSGVVEGMAWSNSSMQGPRLMAGDELRQTLDLYNFDVSGDMTRAFASMETVGERTVDGHACWNVRMTTTAGTQVMNCFDKETGLLDGMSVQTISQMGTLQMESVYSDYRDFGGVKMPARAAVTIGPQQLVTTIRTVSFEAIPDSVFTLPAEVRALRH